MALDPNIKTRPLNINDLDPSEYTVVEEKEDEDIKKLVSNLLSVQLL